MYEAANIEYTASCAFYIYQQKYMTFKLIFNKKLAADSCEIKVALVSEVAISFDRNDLGGHFYCIYN